MPTTEGGAARGRDQAKNVNGRKRHIVLDSLGLLLAVLVTAASVDNANQVTAAGDDDYAYDATGNRDGEDDEINPSGGNQLISDGTWDYSYDDNGNVSKKIKLTGDDTCPGPNCSRSRCQINAVGIWPP